jgi:hypothetical protein
MVNQVRSKMEYFYKHAHLSELFLLHDSLLLADGERSSKNTDDDCPLAYAIAECFGIDAFGQVTPVDERRAA